MESKLYSLKARDIHQKDVALDIYKGKVLLIVNTASQCGYTPQYKGLEELYKKYKGKGFEVLGFPCNQFGAQEPGAEGEIESFCEFNFGVTFPLFAKVEVNGVNTHPVYQFLKSEKAGILGTEGIKWNFTKFLVDRQGQVVKRFAPADEPRNLESAIEALF